MTLLGKPLPVASLWWPLLVKVWVSNWVSDPFFTIKVMIIMMKTMTITMILMLKDVDGGDENIIVVEGCFLSPRPPLKV